MIPGDGVGQEVIPAARRVLDAAGRKFGFTISYLDFDWGSEYFFAARPHDAGRRARECCARTTPSCSARSAIPTSPTTSRLNGLLLPIRRAFDQYANVRPAFLYEGVQIAAADVRGKGADRHGHRAREHRGRVRPGRRLRAPQHSRTRSPCRPQCSRATASSGS